MNNELNFSPNLEGLVLGCIDADFCKLIRVGKLSPRSTQCTPLHRFGIELHRSLSSKSSLKIAEIFADFLQKFAKKIAKFELFAIELMSIH